MEGSECEGGTLINGESKWALYSRTAQASYF